MATKSPRSPIHFAADEVYPIPEVRRRLALGTWAWKTAKRNGLKTVKVGKASYVRGVDILSFLESRAK